MEEKKGITHLLALIAAAQTLGLAGKDIAKDGLGAEDLPKLLELVKEYKTFMGVVTSIDESILEAKDIDPTELVQVVVALISAFKAVKAA